MRRKEGITLIALVVTIIVLIILAGISINLILGENGIITKAKGAKKVTKYTQDMDMIKMAMGVDYIEWVLEEYPEGEDVFLKELRKTDKNAEVDYSDFPEAIVYYNSDYYIVDFATREITNEKEEEIDGIYRIAGAIDNIAPEDLFECEPISDGQIAATDMDSLPIKEARITGIKPQYCNANGYNPKTGNREFEDTNYEIIYNGTKISDTLVIPYQIKIGEELYKVTEVDLSVIAPYSGRSNGVGLPKVETIVYPNTVRKIGKIGKEDVIFSNYQAPLYIKKVILPRNLEEIGDYAFCSTKIKRLELPSSVTKIGDYAFDNCALSSITIPNKVKSIGDCAFYDCSNLRKLILPNTLEEIGIRAFSGCTSLTNVTIPSSVNSIGEYAFEGGYENDTMENINIRKEEGSITGAPWGAYRASINWNYTGE